MTPEKLIELAIEAMHKAYAPYSGFKVGAALLCAGSATLVLQLLQFVVGLFLQLTIPSRFVGFMITAGLSLIAIPVLYPIALSIESIGGETWKE